MNTPRPCSHCKHLYYDAMTTDDVDGYIECTKDLIIGNTRCPGFERYLTEEKFKVKHGFKP